MSKLYGTQRLRPVVRAAQAALRVDTYNCSLSGYLRTVAGAPWFEPLKRLAADSVVLPAGSLRAVAQSTDHVKSWRAVAFYVPQRGV